MIQVKDLKGSEIEEFLQTANYGHLACASNEKPYVVPVHFVYADNQIYIYTTEGKKSEIIRNNPNICLQSENVINNKNWISAIVYGKAEQVTNEEEREKAIKLITEVNPTLTPAVSIRWMDSWVRQNIEVILRVTPDMMTGRESVIKSETGGPVTPPA